MKFFHTFFSMAANGKLKLYSQTYEMIIGERSDPHTYVFHRDCGVYSLEKYVVWVPHMGHNAQARFWY